MRNVPKGLHQIYLIADGRDGPRALNALQLIGPEPDGRRAMGKLFIARREHNRFWHALGIRRTLGYSILLDGRRVATIGPGDTIGLSLSPGSHQVRAKIGIFGSQQFDIDSTSDNHRQLVVGPCVRWQDRNLFAAIVVLLSTLPFYWSVAWVSYHGIDGILAADAGWLGFLLLSNVSLLIVALLFQIIVPVVLRNHAIELIELPSVNLTELPLSDIPRPQPIHARITTGHLMIAVAILAVVFSTSASFTRYERSSHFRMKANTHASDEATFREFERRFLPVAVAFEKAELKFEPLQKLIVQYRVQADYHAAMRRKYELAASQGQLYVEADPPSPSARIGDRSPSLPWDGMAFRPTK